MPVEAAKPRFLLDANVLVSAFAFGGNPRSVVEVLFADGFRNVVTPRLLGEVERNLILKLELPPAKVRRFLVDLSARSIMIRPIRVGRVTGYGPDDEILAAAVGTGCIAIVTGDKRHLLPLGVHRGVAIVPPSVFLRRIGFSAR